MSMSMARGLAGTATHHIYCRLGDVGRYFLLTGDPGRVPFITAALDDARLVAVNRQYTASLLGADWPDVL
jgi:uridine phosphorylase